MRLVGDKIKGVNIVKKSGCESVESVNRDIKEYKRTKNTLVLNKIIEQFTPLMHKFVSEALLGKFNNLYTCKRKKVLESKPVFMVITKEDGEDLLNYLRLVTYKAVMKFNSKRKFKHKKKFNFGKEISFHTFLYRNLHNATINWVTDLVVSHRIKEEHLGEFASNKYIVENPDFNEIENIDIINRAVSLVHNEGAKKVLVKYLCGNRIIDIAKDLDYSTPKVWIKLNRLKHNSKLCKFTEKLSK